MNILYILDFYLPNKGGIEVLFKQIIEHFGDKNKISIITRNFNGKLKEKEERGNITIYRISAKNLIQYVFKARKFCKEIIKEIDIIHASNFYSALVANKLAKKYKKKSILHINGFFGNYRFKMMDNLRAIKFKFLEKINIKLDFDKYIVVSRYIHDVARFHYGVDEKKIELVYNGIDCEKWIKNVKIEKVNNIKEKYKLGNTFSILFYGRIEKVKGLELLLNSIKNIQNIKLLLMVHGDLEYLYKIISELKIKDKIEIIKPQEHNEIPNFIKSVNAVVFPSFIEAFGYVALETSLLEIPLICSEIGAIPEVAFGKVCFFEVNNQKSLENAINNAKQGKFTYIPYKNFDIKETVNKLEKIYKDLLN